ncbi:MAG: aminotransferase class V-fold PLP-dependent enzyme [Proteobacteria bacterium]|jgi:selenocysteine lyase/cysteine desulfurase|nr:aminotransferase class V-fold PLP-dependent enzyme [Pseudomonadota bacterium]
MFDADFLSEIRDRFHHVDNCPYQGPRIFFENAGGSLTLKSVVEVNSHFSSIPDNQGRDNPASHELVRIINQARADMKTFFGVKEGIVFTGESGTELLFRLVRAAILGSPAGGNVVGSTLEHPATVSARTRWCPVAGKENISIAHDKEQTMVTAQDYAEHVDENTRVATIIQTSPVTGMAVDVAAVAKAIRARAPECFIIVDSIQHAAHGVMDMDACGVDACALSGYKVFSRHNYGVAWASPRLSTLPHEKLDGTADDFWELGTRDTGAFATFSEVVNYLDWLGSQVSDESDRRSRLESAGRAMAAQEAHLVDTAINGVEGQTGIRNLPGAYIVGGPDNPYREGLVSYAFSHIPSVDVVSGLNDRGIRTHLRKADYFSGNILDPLGMESCIRTSFCHYNSKDEILALLKALAEITQH